MGVVCVRQLDLLKIFHLGGDPVPEAQICQDAAGTEVDGIGLTLGDRRRLGLGFNYGDFESRVLECNRQGGADDAATDNG